MIAAHHMGEDLLPALVAGGATVVPAYLVIVRARLSRIARAVRRPKAPS
jgi:hypothetical protein